MLSALLLPLAAPAPATPDDAERVDAALAFLAVGGIPLGSYLTAYYIEAAAGAGVDAKAWPEDAPAFDALRFAPPSTTDAWGPYKSDQRIAYAVAVAGYDPRDVGGVDAVARVREGYVGGQFGDPQTINDDVWGILALRAAGERVDAQMGAAVTGIQAARARDGGWSYARAALSSSVDTTGAALAALHAAGVDVRGDEAARAFLDAMRDARTGGYRSMRTTGVGCQATVWAIHARALLGDAPEPAALAYLRGLQRPDGGFARDAASDTDVWCTLEAIPILAGARHPMPGWTAGEVRLDVARATEPSAFEVAGALANATWRIDGRVHEGLRVEVALPRADDYAWSVHAVGPQGQMRARGVVSVPGVPPVARVDTNEVEAYVRARVALDASRSSDRDGEIVATRVSWGDGNASEGRAAEHAYARPGEYVARLRVKDDTGLWSDDVVVLVRVVNRAPVLALPDATLETDRTRPLPPLATDPEGETVELRWGADERAGPLTLPPGDHVVPLVARDPHGAQARGELRVRVVNLPPSLAALDVPANATPGAPLRLATRAVDPDGETPRVEWRVADATLAGEEVSLALPAGTYEVEATATDADGATARRVATLVVASAPLRITAPPPAREEAPAERATPRAAPPPARADPPEERAGREAAAWGAVASAEAAPLETASLTPAPSAPPPRETPLPWWMALAALGLARRGRRAPSGRR